MTEPVEIRVNTAAGLFAALAAPDPMARCAALTAVLRDPGLALRYGRHDGRDVVDALLERLEEAAGDIELRLAVAALAAYDDPRVVERMREVFARPYDEDVLTLAARRLTALEPADRHACFAPWLMQDRWPVQARLAADALRDSPHLRLEERVRLASVAPSLVADPPPVDAASRRAWVRELNGECAQGARAQIKRLGEPAWRTLLEGPGLTAETHAWLLAWGATDFPDAVLAPLQAALGHPDADLAREALRLVSRLGPERAAALREAVVPFARASDPAVRLDALRAGATVQTWRVVARQDLDPRARVAAVRWMAREDGAQAAEALARCLAEDADWRVRAAAADALVALGEAALPVVEPLLHHDRTAVRAAAYRVLLALGREDWLEAAVLW